MRLDPTIDAFATQERRSRSIIYRADLNRLRDVVTFLGPDRREQRLRAGGGRSDQPVRLQLRGGARDGGWGS
jgi:hypothetical protein